MTNKQKARLKTLAILLAGGACIGVAVSVGSASKRPRAAVTSSASPVSSGGSSLKSVSSAQCEAGETASPATPAGNPKARAAARKGLEFLSKATVAWQNQHNCYGCHVQAVTLEALAVGKHNQYDFDRSAIDEVLRGMLELAGGARTAGGLQYHGGSLLNPSKAFGGAAFARYDALVGPKVRDDLSAVAGELLERQRADGSYDMQYENGPVAVGDVQGTYMAIRTWKQAYESSADPKWLTAVQNAERYLHKKGDSLRNSKNASAQHLSYTLMGLIEAGMGPSEELAAALRDQIVSLQDKDGRWVDNLRGASALTTGQALSALRKLGMTENDAAVAKGTQWLIEHQSPDGSWSQLGSQKAEAMWAVLGLVTLDVLTIDLSGIAHSSHSNEKHTLLASAHDNKGGKVVKMEVVLDDIRIASECGSELRAPINAGALEGGKHVIIVSATNSEGKTSKRRLEFYSGNTYVTQIGSRFENNRTLFSGRSLAPKEMDGRVRVRILSEDGDEVASMDQEASKSALEFAWNGMNKGGGAQKSGKYKAKVELVDKTGAVLQSEELSFVHDTEKAARANYGNVAGKLGFAKGAGNAENAMVELVDEGGNVVDRVRSTKMGRYQFKNVPKGSYKVRMKKRGFRAKEQAIKAEPAQAVEADMTVEEE